ncbi:hypothetical protein NE237_025004 [Protea cynaroides]|uniref:Uncharacterized protein n=1 Tax=Protea cynaroides TaxID=273540 RepID=A0A9Q0H425_9MAGN|nr:hypothetical protein NE237_025004 [Protea cynaroides]
MGQPEATDDNEGEQSPKEVDTSEKLDPDLSAKLLNEFNAKASLKSHRSCISEMFLDYEMGQMTRDRLPRCIHWDFIETNGRFRIVEQLSLSHRLESHRHLSQAQFSTPLTGRSFGIASYKFLSTDHFGFLQTKWEKNKNFCREER